ncbi:MAG: TonB family protein [Bacteroidetes bacterium]|nr:MAG: TonB family protein [Bacteroidota bacterium]
MAWLKPFLQTYPKPLFKSRVEIPFFHRVNTLFSKTGGLSPPPFFGYETFATVCNGARNWKKIGGAIIFAAMKKLLGFIFMFISFHSIAQDTIFLNYEWDECKKGAATYYRLISKKDKIYEVNDYFKSNGKLQMNGFYKDKKMKTMHGKFTWYYESGNLKRLSVYENGKRANDTDYFYMDSVGLRLLSKYIFRQDTLLESISYYPSGACYEQKKYENEEIRTGITYYETGEIKRKDYYNRKGEWRNGQCFKKNGEDTAYYPSIVYPIIDGLTSFYQPEFISKYIVYPEHARMRGIQGKAIISYTVESDGTLSNIKLLYATHDFFGESALEAMRMITNNWIPAKKEGQISKITITQPVKFTLN